MGVGRSLTLSKRRVRECSSMAELQLPKLVVRVRFPSLALLLSVLNLIETLLNLDETVEPNGSGTAGRDGNRAETSLVRLET